MSKLIGARSGRAQPGQVIQAPSFGISMRPLASSLSRPALRLRDYLRLVRLMIGDTRDQVYAIRATLEGQLAHLLAQTSAQGAEIAHLRAELGAHVAQLESASAAR